MEVVSQCFELPILPGRTGRCDISHQATGFKICVALFSTSLVRCLGPAQSLMIANDVADGSYEEFLVWKRERIMSKSGHHVVGSDQDGPHPVVVDVGLESAFSVPFEDVQVKSEVHVLEPETLVPEIAIEEYGGYFILVYDSSMLLADIEKLEGDFDP